MMKQSDKIEMQETLAALVEEGGGEPALVKRIRAGDKVRTAEVRAALGCSLADLHALFAGAFFLRTGKALDLRGWRQ